MKIRFGGWDVDQGGQDEEANQAAPGAGRRIVCHECDLLQYAGEVPRGGSLHCVRCDAPLQRWVAHGLDRPVALALAAAISFIIANLFPIMSLEFQALRLDATMVASVWQLHEQGETLVGVLVLVTAVLAPAALILLFLWLLLPLRFGFRAPAFAPLFRVFTSLSAWAMIEVLMLGVVVALVKLGHMATASAGIGLWAYGATMLLLTLLSNSLHGDVIWSHHEGVMGQRAPVDTEQGELAEVTT